MRAADSDSSRGIAYPLKTVKTQKDWSRAAYPPQRSLRAALGCCPTTAGGAQFCLLCCQPGPVPESLPARPPSLTQGRPCRPPVWLGHPIHTASRTCHGPQRFISQVPMRGTGRHDPPQRKYQWLEPMPSLAQITPYAGRGSDTRAIAATKRRRRARRRGASAGKFIRKRCGPPVARS